MAKTKWFIGVALGTVAALLAGQADAHHHHHYDYGSYGSCGSSGGSYGSSGGSYGSCGSSGGSYGSYGSSGGSSGSSGGSSGGTVAADTPATAVALSDTQGQLTLNVPEDAVVYLVDQRMTLAGTVRTYVIPGLKPGREYRYPVRVESVQNGQLYRAVSEPRVHAGQQLSLAFAYSSNQPQMVARQN